MKKFSISFKTLKMTPLIKGLCFISALIPFAYFLFLFYDSLEEFKYFETRIENVRKKAVRNQLTQEKEEHYFASLKKADHFYLDNQIENLLFLEPEVKRLETHSLEQPLSELLKKRLQFLKDGQNRLHFTEEKIQRFDKIQEVQEKQQRPVEMNEEDLKKLLCLIEAIPLSSYLLPEGRPQLIIEHFELSKKDNDGKERVFVINMQLIKREYLQD